MMNPWTLAALWVGSALIATLLAIRFGASSARSLVGVAARPGIGVAGLSLGLSPDEWQIAFLTGTAPFAHNFLAGTERLASNRGTGIRHFLHRNTRLFTIGPGAGKAESLCLKLQNSKHLKSWTRAATPHLR